MSNTDVATGLAWVDNIESLTLENETFRTVVHTGAHSQLTLMSIPPGGEIGWEQHGNLDQFLRVEQGAARLEIGTTEDAVDETHNVSDDWAMIIPAGTWHNVINTSDTDLRLYSIYSPPEHPQGTIHLTKAESDAAEHDH